jgi:hypothetical protein
MHGDDSFLCTRPCFILMCLDVYEYTCKYIFLHFDRFASVSTQIHMHTHIFTHKTYRQTAYGIRFLHTHTTLAHRMTRHAHVLSIDTQKKKASYTSSLRPHAERHTHMLSIDTQKTCIILGFCMAAIISGSPIIFEKSTPAHGERVNEI